MGTPVQSLLHLLCTATFQDVAPLLSSTNTAAFPPLYCKNEAIELSLGQGCCKGESPLLFPSMGWSMQQCQLSPGAWAPWHQSLQLTQALRSALCVYWHVAAALAAVAGRLPVASPLTLPARAVCHILTSKFSAQEPGQAQRGREGETPDSLACHVLWRVGTENKEKRLAEEEAGKACAHLLVPSSSGKAGIAWEGFWASSATCLQSRKDVLA